MPRELVLPELAESVVEGEIVKWLVAEGETVARDQPVVEVMTDKVTVELPSPFAGVLEAQLVAEGAVVAVHTPIARFADEGATSQGETETQLEHGGVTSDPTPTADLVLDEPSATELATEEEDDGDARSLFRASADEEGEPVLVPAKPRAPRRSRLLVIVVLVIGIGLFAYAYRVDHNAGWPSVSPAHQAEAERRFTVESARIAGLSDEEIISMSRLRVLNLSPELLNPAAAETTSI